MCVVKHMKEAADVDRATTEYALLHWFAFNDRHPCRRGSPDAS